MTTYKRVYKYNLKSSTHAEFDRLRNSNFRYSRGESQHPIKKNLSQLTPANVLAIEGYYDSNVIAKVRTTVYRFAKILNITVETTFSREKKALLVRLKGFHGYPKESGSGVEDRDRQVVGFETYT